MPTIETKKFLDANGLTYFARKLNNYPTNDVIEAVIDGMQDALDEKVDISRIGATNGVASLGSDGKVPSGQLPDPVTYSFDGTYNASTNKAATVQTVQNAISALNGGTIGTPSASKTLTALSQTGGNISATFSNIAISKSQVTDLGTIGTAAAKGVDTSISNASTSTNLPTSKAVADFVEGKGYKTTDNNTTYTLTQDSEDGHIITLTPSVGSAMTVTVPDNNTDTTVTSSATHYTPVSDGTADITANASGASAAWSIDVVKGVTLNTDGKGHVTGLSVVSGKIAANPNRYRPIKVNGTQILSNTSSTALDLVNGGNVTITNNSGVVTISSANTTYTLTQDSTDGHILTFTPSVGSPSVITIPDNNTTYTAADGITLNGTQFKHSNAVTSGTAGTSAATSGSTLAVPYITYDAQGHVTASGTHTHTISGFVPTSRTINSKALTGNITLASSDIGAVALAQGSENSGKFLIVNSEGNVEATSMAVWQGGSY